MRVWSHGYNVEVPYTYGYYKETSPLWIKWAGYLGGRKPPKEGKLRVLELGCGQGYNLCIHASAFPEIEFVGIDFNPSHISHAEELAAITGLSNVKFIEGDFLELRQSWEFGKFHYVILHGIWTWIDKPVREAVVDILKEAVLPGGMVYISYDSMPGWLPGTFIREVLSNYYRMTQKPALQAVSEGLEILKKFQEFNAPIFRVYPNLKERFESTMKLDRHYVVHEYMHEAHKIFWVYEVIDEVIPAKLYYAASANLTDNYLPALLPENVRNYINSFPHPVFRLFLIDLFINQAFRRDIYQKGEVRPFPVEQLRDIRGVKFISKEEIPEQFKFQLGFGEVEGKREIYEPIMQELKKGERSVEELLQVKPLSEIGVLSVVQALTLLMSKDLVTIYNENHDIAHTQQFNRNIIKLASEGRPYNFLCCPVSGMGVAVSAVEMILLDIVSEGNISTDDLSERALKRLKQQGKSLVKDGKPITEPKEEMAEMMLIVIEFLSKKLPKLKALKVVP